MNLYVPYRLEEASRTPWRHNMPIGPHADPAFDGRIIEVECSFNEQRVDAV